MKTISLIILTFYFVATLGNLKAMNTMNNQENINLKNIKIKKWKQKSEGQENQENQEAETQKIPTVGEQSKGKLELEELEEESHIFGLKVDDSECHGLFDSRGILSSLEIFGFNFGEWHKDAIEKIRELTPEVRKKLHFRGRPSNTNLLLHSVDLIFSNVEDSTKHVIKEDPVFWVSGWPGSYNRKTLEEEFPNVSFKFFDDFLLPEQRNLSSIEKAPLLMKTFFNGYCFEQHGYLIKERHEYLQKSCLKANEKKENYEHFNRRFLHTEQALLWYLTTKSFKKKIIKTLKEIESASEAVMVVNMASTNSICLHCADRIFRESEWGYGFLKSVREKSGVNLKVHFLASACDPYQDDLGLTNDSKELRARLKREKKIHKEIGFNGESKINFMSAIKGRQQFKKELPLIGHSPIERVQSL